jgi:hypothetical protein
MGSEQTLRWRNISRRSRRENTSWLERVDELRPEQGNSSQKMSMKLTMGLLTADADEEVVADVAEEAEVEEVVAAVVRMPAEEATAACKSSFQRRWAWR